MNCKVGEEVGYSIRFEDVTSTKTRIKFLTDGLLLREALVDPLLSRYSIIMVDEAHERSLSSDILLGILKKIRRKRTDLKIIISSATLQAEEIVQFFNDAAVQTADKQRLALPETVFYLEGRAYPVDIHYMESPAEDYVAASLKTVFDIHAQEPLGDILVFLTGKEEIDYAVQEIANTAAKYPSYSAILAVPLYAGLPTDSQMAVFDPTPENTRKVILATNIAEASVTIDGVVYVVDCGFVKLRAYNPTTGIETLTAVPVSKASAKQRSGRAGRTKPGKCYRLYTATMYNRLPETTVPEVQRSNLALMILQLKALGVDNIARFPFLTAPPATLVTRGLDLLYSLGALDDYAKLTKPLGVQMAELAIDPMMAKALLASTLSKFNCLSEILSIAAMTSLQEGSVWFSHEGERKAMENWRRRFAAEEGDAMTLLNVYQAFVTKGRKEAKWCRENHLNFKSMSRAVSVRNQLRRYLQRFGIDVEESLSRKSSDEVNGAAQAQQVSLCLTSGFFAQAARMQPDGSFRTVNGNTTLHAHPSSLLFNRKADWVIFQQVMETSNKIFIRDITKIERNWLTELAPDFYQIRR